MGRVREASEELLCVGRVLARALDTDGAAGFVGAAKPFELTWRLANGVPSEALSWLKPLALLLAPKLRFCCDTEHQGQHEH